MFTQKSYLYVFSFFSFFVKAQHKFEQVPMQASTGIKDISSE